MFKALVVENDRKKSSSYCAFLMKQGYEATPARDANTALEAFESGHVDIVLCSNNLPGIDGPMIVESLRNLDQDVPVIAISKTGDFRAKQRAFLAGCDDLMVEPVDLNELDLRMTALLRRSHSVSKRQIVIGDAVLDSNSFTVVEGSMSVVLPPKEFMVLFKLCASPDRIFTRRDIMDDVWGIHTESGERTVDVHIKRLRDRFKTSKSFQIETVRGVGYKATAL